MEVYLIYYLLYYFVCRYRNKSRKNNKIVSIAVDHEYLTNQPKFMPKEQYDFLRNKKSMMISESNLNNFKLYCCFYLCC